jgi:hypothetical protein
MQRAPSPFADLEKPVVRCCFGRSTLRPYTLVNAYFVLSVFSRPTL